MYKKKLPTHDISFTNANYKRFLCTIPQKRHPFQLDLPSTNVFFWCPAGFICSPSTAECLKIDEYSYHQGYQFFDFFQYLYLLCITVASIFIVKFLYSLLHYLTSSNEAVLFHRPRRRNTPVDRLLYWISFQFFKMKVRWKG